ncbi:MAG: hypothetical protein K6A43_06235 [Treponema sp.]|nr:hypothetical protein [Treponema sp.]
MEKKSIKILNVFLILGLMFFAALFVIAVFESGKEHNIIIDILPFIQVALGLFGLIFTLVYTRKAYQIFIELTLISWGLLAFFVIKKIFPYTMLQCWPMIGVFSGLWLLLSGLYHYRKIKFGYFIPSITLFGLGIVFMLFSFNILSISFQTTALICGPLFMLAAAVFIICLYFAQKKNKKLILNDDGKDSFDDEVLN